MKNLRLTALAVATSFVAMTPAFAQQNGSSATPKEVKASGTMQVAPKNEVNNLANGGEIHPLTITCREVESAKHPSQLVYWIAGFNAAYNMKTTNGGSNPIVTVGKNWLNVPPGNIVRACKQNPNRTPVDILMELQQKGPRTSAAKAAKSK